MDNTEDRLIHADDFLDLFYVASAGQDKMFIRTVEMVVEDTPTVEVVHGRWEYGKWEQGHWVKGNERCRCSVCHRDFAVDNLNIWNGCPHCLAKMDLE